MKTTTFSLAIQTLLAAALATFTAGCALTRPLKGGRAATTPTPAGALAQSLTQSENPAATAKQSQDTLRVRTYTLPAPAPSTINYQRSPLPPAALSTPNPQPSTLPPSGLSTLNPQPSTFAPSGLSTLNSQPSTILVTEREETHATTELGPAQKDSARELGAKLASLRPITWLGAFLFVFGLASLAYPPLRAIVNSVTTSAAFILGGLTLIVLPTLLAANELLILGGVLLALVAWSLAHRHGQLRGFIDANKNGIDDRLENPPRLPQEPAQTPES